MTIEILNDFEQGSGEWQRARMGIVTASEVSSILTPAKLEYSKSADDLINRLASERIRGLPTETFTTFDMERGKLDEVVAREMYAEHYAPVEQVGFIKRTFDFGPIGFSPDGLVGDDGIIECKSRLPKHQVATVANGEMPRDYWLQVQAGLLVSGRKWCDFVSYSDGMHLFVQRIEACPETQAKITAAVEKLYADLQALEARYWDVVGARGLQRIKPVMTLED